MDKIFIYDPLVSGVKGLVYMLMSPQDYLARQDAWPILQERTAEYLKKR